METRELLATYGFDGEATPFVRGSAMLAHDNPTDPDHVRCINELLNALDMHIPDPERDVDKPFLMPVENVFAIDGRGTVVTGSVEQGIVRVGDHLEIVGLADKSRGTVCTSIEAYNRIFDEGRAGDSIGCLLRGVRYDEVHRGHVLAAKGSIVPRTRFEAEVYVLSKEEGGRHTPFFSGYSPQFFFRTSNVTGVTKSARRRRHVAARRRSSSGSHVNFAGSLQRRRPLRNSRRRPNRRFGRCRNDKELAAATNVAD
jgi:elongation factor Tu